MKFTAIKENILPYINYTNSFTSPKHLNPIIQNIKLSLEGNELTMQATNYQVGFSCNFEVNMVEEGRITVSAKKLLDIIKQLPDGSLIEFDYDSTRLNITSGRSSFKLSTISSEGFPTISDILAEYNLKLSSKELSAVLKKVWFCIASESQKIEYTGAQFNISGNLLEVFATGLQRVAIATIEFPAEYSDDFTINIPRKTIIELIKVLDAKPDSDVEIFTDKSQISFRIDNMTIYSKLIEKFVKGVSRLFTNEYPVTAKLNTKNFIEASKRVSSITSDDTPGIALSFDSDKLKLSSLETEYGQGFETIDNVESNRDVFEIVLNAKHVNEILSNIETEYFTFEMIDKRSPVLITPDTDKYRYLVVPISVEKL